MPTLSDVAKMQDPTGKILRIAELLRKLSPLVDDAPWVQGNLPLGHRVGVETSLPTVSSRRLNQRTQPSTDTTEQVDEQCALIDAYSQVDTTLANLNGNAAAYRFSKAKRYMRAMTYEFERQAMYGNPTTTQEEMRGLITRLTTAGDTVIDAGGAGADNGSILLVGWSPETVYCAYPKGDPNGTGQGIQHTDKGIVTSETSDGLIEVYRDHWSFCGGIVVENPNYLGAVRAIDISSTVADPTGATINLVTNMLSLIHGIEDIDSPLIKPVFYMPRTLAKMLDIQAQNKSNLQLEVGMEEGKRKVSLRGIPIHVSDAMTETEAVI